MKLCQSQQANVASTISLKQLGNEKVGGREPEKDFFDSHLEWDEGATVTETDGDKFLWEAMSGVKSSGSASYDTEMKTMREEIDEGWKVDGVASDGGKIPIHGVKLSNARRIFGFTQMQNSMKRTLLYLTGLEYPRGENCSSIVGRKNTDKIQVFKVLNSFSSI
jgi:hypothetical protein